MGLLLIQMVVLIMEDTEMKEILNAFFASVFTAEDNSQESQNFGIREGQRKEDFPQVIDSWVRDQLGRLHMYKSIKPDGMPLQVLRDLMGVVTLLFSTTFEKPQRMGEVPYD